MALTSGTRRKITVNTSGSPPTATIPKSQHRLKNINYVIPVVKGSSATPVAYNVNPDTLDITITTGAAATVDVYLG